MWVDSSIELTSSNLSATFDQMLKTNGVAVQSTTGHSNFAVTHETMYRYLPTRIDKMKSNEQREASNIVMYRTRSVVTYILKWFVLCSLERSCIAPIMNRFCHFKGEDRFNTFADCNRYDQSLLNILLNNYFNFNSDLFFVRDASIRVERLHKLKWPLKRCRPMPRRQSLRGIYRMSGIP